MMNDRNYISIRTNQSDVNISVAEHLTVARKKEKIKELDRKVYQNLLLHRVLNQIWKKERLSVYKGEREKLISIRNSKDFDDKNPLASAIDDLNNDLNFEMELSRSKDAWEEIWKKAFKVEGTGFSRCYCGMLIFISFGNRLSPSGYAGYRNSSPWFTW